MRAVLVGLGYYAGAKLGFALTMRPHPVSTLWAPNAVLLASFLLTPPRSWWLLLGAAFPAHLAAELGSGVPFSMVLCWFATNTSEALIGAFCIRRFSSLPIRLDRFAPLVGYLAFAVVLAPVLSSFLDAGCVLLNHWGRGGYWNVWQMRTLSDALAEAVIGPAIVAWGTFSLARFREAPARRYLEGAVVVAALASVSLLAFGRTVELWTMPSLLYAPLPVLVYAATRFGSIGVSSSLPIIVVLSIFPTVHGRGPFALASPEMNALSVQLLYLTMAGTLLGLAAAVEERKRAQQAALRRGEQLQMAVDAAQLELWDLRIPPDWMQPSRRWRRRPAAGPHAEVARAKLPPRSEGCRVVAMVRRMRAVSSDIQQDSARDDSSEPASALGIRSGWTTPGRIPRGEVVGSIATHGPRSRGPNAAEVHVLDRTAQRGAIAVERKRNDVAAVERQRQLAHLGRISLLGEMAGALAHELKQPLTAILGNAQAAQRLIARESVDVAQLRDILSDIVAENRRAVDVIDGVRAMLRQPGFPMTAVEVNDVVREALRLARGTLAADGIRVRTLLGPAIPAVAAHRVQIEQVLINLVINACDAMVAAGRGERELTICTESSADGASVQLTVTDTGPGIPAEQIDRIFEPFVTSKLDGLGLGLSICRSIVRAHGGQLWAGNNTGRGATFYVSLPVAAAASITTGSARPQGVI